jgi:cytochrome c biogenesis protein CcmG/thiol:disulfide interchange protein DsbE
VPDSSTLDDDTTERPPTPASATGRTLAGMPVRLLVVGTLVAAILAVAAGALVAISADGDDDGDDVASLQDDDVLEPIDEGSAVGTPLALAYESFEGESLNTAGYLGTPLVLNFFAAWCAPCLVEMPAFEQVHQQVADDVAFLGLSIDTEASDGLAVVESTGVTYDVGHSVVTDAVGQLGGTGMPTTVFIDAAGTVLEVHSGELSGPELQALIDEHFG